MCKLWKGKKHTERPDRKVRRCQKQGTCHELILDSSRNFLRTAAPLQPPQSSGLARLAELGTTCSSARESNGNWKPSSSLKNHWSGFKWRQMASSYISASVALVPFEEEWLSAVLLMMLWYCASRKLLVLQAVLGTTFNVFLFFLQSFRYWFMLVLCE